MLTAQQQANLRATMLILGVIACGVGTWGIVHAWPTARWDETTGTVTASTLIQVSDGPDEAEIAYEYRVAGRRYTGSRVGYLRFVSQRAAYRFLNDHPAGSPIAVYFDPRDPSNAVLQRGGAGNGLFIVAAGIALLLTRQRSRRHSGGPGVIRSDGGVVR